MNSGYLNCSLPKTTGNYSLFGFSKLFKAVFKASLKTLHADENTAPSSLEECEHSPLKLPSYSYSCLHFSIISH